MRANYLSSAPNPFNLVGPPDWFLNDLAQIARFAESGICFYCVNTLSKISEV